MSRIACSLYVVSLFVLGGCGRERPESSSRPVESAEAATPAVVKVDNSAQYSPKIGRPGGTLVLSSISSPKSFNPILQKEASSSVVTGFIFSGLTRTNGATLLPEPDLAESWEVSEDGLAYVFTLRDGLRWSDGQPLTAGDVKFTFDLIYDPDIPNSSADIFSIDGKRFQVEALDDRRVRFALPTRFAPFLRSMSQEVLPRHVLERPWKEGNFNSTWGVNTPPREMVGSGSFILVEYRPAERVVLERNPYYWRKGAAGNRLPYLDRVIHMIVQDTNVALLKFRSGEVDLYGMRGVDVQVLAPARTKENFTIYDAGPALGSSFLVFNENPGKDEKGKPFVEPRKLKWFRNVLFRRAASHAIDRGAIIETLMNGWGYPQYGPMTESEGLFYNPDIAKFAYDPERAKELLRSIGLRDYNHDGFLEDPEGQDVQFDLFTNAENDVRIRIANSIRKDFENVGIRVNFLPLEFNVLVSKLGNSPYDWEAILLGLTGGPEPHFGQNVWHSSGHLHEWYPEQESPDTPEEAEIDRIFSAGVQELDPAKRKALYDRWQAIAAEQQWMIYTVSPASLTAVRNKFGNLDPRPISGMLHNLEELYILQP